MKPKELAENHQTLSLSGGVWARDYFSLNLHDFILRSFKSALFNTDAAHYTVSRFCLIQILVCVVRNYNGNKR